MNYAYTVFFKLRGGLNQTSDNLRTVYNTITFYKCNHNILQKLQAVICNSKFHEFIQKRRIIFLMHSSFLRRIWLNFMAQYVVFSAFYTSYIFFRTSNFFDPSTTDKTSLVELGIWCIKIGIVLTLHCNQFPFP